MWKSDIFNSIIDLLLERKLGEAIGQLENYLYTRPGQYDAGALQTLKADFQLMTDYWRKGFADNEREKLYNRLLRRMYLLTLNLYIDERTANTPVIRVIAARPRHRHQEWLVSDMREELENHVASVALLALEPENLRAAKEQELYERHQQTMNDLFDYVWTSHGWSASVAADFAGMLLLPTIDSMDQQLLVSAVTLSVMNVFDIGKLRVLYDVCMKSKDEKVRLRSLTGLVFSLDDRKAALFTEVRDMMAELVSDEQTRQELTELQMQLFFCLNVESDTQLIKQEIMPSLLEHSNVKLTPRGLEEIDEDTLNDILHPDAAERNIEKVEESMRKMADMQKQGSDIYFGGFSQMKRFPFFNDISSWFVPFYPQHPAVSRIWNQAKGTRLLHLITEIGAFCDSDKYSFVFAYEQVLARLPKNMLKMVEDGEATPMMVGGEVAVEEQRKPAFMRRMYLHNLYRFFRLYSSRSEFLNPFSQGDVQGDTAAPRWLFFASPLFRATALEERFAQVSAFLIKHRMYREASLILEGVAAQHRDYQFCMMAGTLTQHGYGIHDGDGKELKAAEWYRRAVALQPDSLKAHAGLARAAFGEQHYQEAYDAYKLLIDQEGDQPVLSHELGAAICLIHLGRATEATTILFRLNYLHPDDKHVTRALAWALTVSGKWEQAEKHYQQIIGAGDTEAEDLLNNGYLHWFQRHIPEAVDSFQRFCKTSTSAFDMRNEFFVTEHRLIADHGITDTEIQLMLDALSK